MWDFVAFFRMPGDDSGAVVLAPLSAIDSARLLPDGRLAISTRRPASSATVALNQLIHRVSGAIPGASLTAVRWFSPPLGDPLYDQRRS